MTSPALDIEALYEDHVRPLAARDKLRLLSRLADDLAQTAPVAAEDAGGSSDGEVDEDPFVVEDGLLVVTGPLHGSVPDHRDLRDEHLSQVAGLPR